MKSSSKPGDGSAAPKPSKADFVLEHTEVIVHPEMLRLAGRPWMLDLSTAKPTLYVESLEVANELLATLNYLRTALR